MLIQLFQFVKYFTRRRILNSHILGLFVLVDREVVSIVYEFLLRYEKALLGALACCFLLQVAESLNDIGNIVIRNLGTLVVEAEAVGLHVIKPYFVGTASAGLCKYQHSGGNACIWLEYAGRHRDHRTELVVFDELFANGFMCRG